MLSRLKMRQGALYDAITTILNYAIIAIGAMTVFGSFGVSWDKLQWLAAAPVGLGFGLQKSSVNFVLVSDYSVLNARSTGDTVTIGTFSGTVSKDPYPCHHHYRLP